MDAELDYKFRRELSEGKFIEAVVWLLPKPLPGSAHSFKYRLAYVDHDKCVVRFDNERGKGDHMHIGDQEFDYKFVDTKKLMVDFMVEVEKFKK